MEDILISQDLNISNVTSDGSYYSNNYTDISPLGMEYYIKHTVIVFVMTCTIPAIGFPLILMAIYALYSMVRNDHTAPIYVINLLLSDLIQLFCMLCEVVLRDDITFFLYHYSLMASVGFMVCIAMERYLLIAWPLWYRFRRTIKSSVVVCVLIWSLPIIYIVSYYYYYVNSELMHGILLLLPFPLLLFFLGGTLKALSASASVPNDEKRRIVGVLLLVLLIYTLLFLPNIIADFSYFNYYYIFRDTSIILIKLSPLADSALYIFFRKGTIKLLVSPCCCRIFCSDISRPTV